MEWLKPFMTERKYRKGDMLFRKDDAAHEMLLTVTGKFLVTEIGVELPPGQSDGRTRLPVAATTGAPRPSNASRTARC